MAEINKDQEWEELHRAIWAIADKIRTSIDEIVKEIELWEV